jgi:HK97 family phage prohead protease
MAELGVLDESGSRLTGTATLLGTEIERGPEMALLIEPGAFTAAARDPGRVTLLWQHQDEKVIGHLESIAEEGARLQVSARINPSEHVPEARRFVALFRHGDIRELSVGFEWLRWEQDTSSKRTVFRIIKARLLEVSTVTWGAAGDAAAVQTVMGGRPPARGNADVARIRSRMLAANA